MSTLIRVRTPLLGAALVVLTLPGIGAAQPADALPVAVAPVAPVALSAVMIQPPAAAPPPPQATTPPPPPGAPEGDQDMDAPPPPPAAPPPPGARRSVRPQQARPASPPEAPRAERQRLYASKGVNIRIDATITESRGDQVLGRKVVTLTVVDGERGQVRSTQQVPYRLKGSNGFNYQNAPLNMDAQALLRDDGRVLVSLTLDYRGGAPETGNDVDAAPPPPERITGTLDQGIRQSVAVVLESGKPLVVAQSADAVGDRRVTLELKATVLK